jgi:hypothetical protein
VATSAADLAPQRTANVVAAQSTAETSARSPCLTPEPKPRSMSRSNAVRSAFVTDSRTQLGVLLSRNDDQRRIMQPAGLKPSPL